jgi:hypothetical protein
VKAGGDLSPLDHAKLVDRTWNKLGGWSRYHGGGFYCLLVREKERGGPEHFHILIHVPPSKASLFDRTFRAWFDKFDDIDIRPADQSVRRASSKLQSIIGYLTKQRSPQAWGTAYLRRRADRVLGKRARISRTLLPSYVPPTPISTSVVKPVPMVSIPAPSIKSEAAHEHRHKIKIGNLINRLQEIGLGHVEGSQVSVNAALGLLRKALPDLQATQHSGEADNPVTVRTIITGVRRDGE